MPEPPAGAAVVITGEYLLLGDVRRFVARMDAGGAGDDAVVMGSATPELSHRGDEFPAGLTTLTGIGGYPRASRSAPPRREE